MNNIRDFSKICRVCMTDGSRDIFQKITNTPGISGASPLDRLLEKLRYVTMMKIEENDDLPRLLCDLCIVQLNVAYNFKRQAIENDTKLRQYFIENGMSSSKSNTTPVTVNTSSSSISIENQNIRRSFAASTTGTVSSPQLLEQQQQHRESPIQSAASSAGILSNHHHNHMCRPIQITPFIIKTEPQDDNNDALSDSATDISSINRNGRLTPSSTIHTSTPSGINTNSINNKSANIFSKNSSSIVYINGYGYNSNVTPSSEVESYRNGGNEQQNQNKSVQDIRQNNDKTNKTVQLKRKSKINNINNKVSSSASTTSSTSKEKNKTDKKRLHHEVKNLSIDMNVTLPANGGKRIRVAEFKKNDSNMPVKSQSRKNSIDSSLKTTHGRGRPTKSSVNTVGTTINSSQLGTLEKNTNGNNSNILTTPKASTSSSLKTASSIVDKGQIFINPYSKQSNMPGVITDSEVKLKKKRLYNEGRVKERTLSRFIRPKLELNNK